MRCLIPLLLIVAASLSGCSEPNTIDASTVDSYKTSILSLTKKLDSQERESFMEALAAMEYDKGDLLNGSSLDTPDISFLSYVNGKTIGDIERDAAALEVARKNKELQDKKQAEDLHNKQQQEILQNEERLKEERNMELIEQEKQRESSRKSAEILAEIVEDMRKNIECSKIEMKNTVQCLQREEQREIQENEKRKLLEGIRLGK